jgi:uncharacterized PurR-regulated membrane protein YhhQ (DUF165 family)
MNAAWVLAGLFMLATVLLLSSVLLERWGQREASRVLKVTGGFVPAVGVLILGVFYLAGWIEFE